MAKLNKVVGVCKSAPKWETDVVMPDMSIVTQSSDNYKDWVLLFFYPLDFTFVCPTEIIEFSDKASEFKKIGCDILGCSVDSQFTVKYSHMFSCIINYSSARIHILCNNV